VLASGCVIAPAKLRAQRKQVEPWQSTELLNFTVVLCEAFVEAHSKPRRISSHIQRTSPLDTALHLRLGGSHSVAQSLDPDPSRPIVSPGWKAICLRDFGAHCGFLPMEV